MALANDYNSVMARRGEIMKKSVGIDYTKFERPIASIMRG